MHRCLVVIAGPTAVGKTATAISLAKHFNTEIISADSRQFYRELNIGTAKPNDSELAAAKHHFINNLSISDSYTVADFQKEALAVLDQLFKIHPVVILTGGSGLFINAVLYGLDELPDVDLELREKLNQELEQKGLAYFVEKLKEIDPVTYTKIDLHNPRRVLRAIEIYESSRQIPSQVRTNIKAERSFTSVNICLDRPRAELYERVNLRVDQMFEAGLVEEVKGLIPYEGTNALNTVGYKEVFEHLKGNASLEEAKSLVKQNTRRYAKRQLTWFRKNSEYSFFHPDDLSSIIRQITQQCSGS